jgi:hypothetical protein
LKNPVAKIWRFRENPDLGLLDHHFLYSGSQTKSAQMSTDPHDENLDPDTSRVLELWQRLDDAIPHETEIPVDEGVVWVWQFQETASHVECFCDTDQRTGGEMATLYHTHQGSGPRKKVRGNILNPDHPYTREHEIERFRKALMDFLYESGSPPSIAVPEVLIRDFLRNRNIYLAYFPGPWRLEGIGGYCWIEVGDSHTYHLIDVFNKSLFIP